MKTFYDYRNIDRTNPKKYPLQGYVLIKYKEKWLLWIKNDTKHLNMSQLIKGFIVCPKTIFLYDIYLAKNLRDGLKKLFYKPKKLNSKIFTKVKNKYL